MADLGVDDDLVRWTQCFLTDRWVELVISGYFNPKHKVETGIPQGSPVSPTLFLIYTSGVSEIETRLSQITCLSFMENLGFLAAGNSVLEIKKALEKAGKINLDCGTRNAITYDISKMEAIMFFKDRNQKLVTQLTNTGLRFGGQTVWFNQEATPCCLRQIQIAAVQPVALYGAEVWWKIQKSHQNEVQKLINGQARSITGMYPSTPIAALISESGLTPAHILLDLR